MNMRILFAAVALVTSMGLATSSYAAGSIDAVFAACKAVATTEERQLCQGAMDDYLGTGRSMGRRAETLMRQLSRAAEFDRVDPGSVVIGLEIIQKSEMPKTAKKRAFANALQFSDLETHLSPSFASAPQALSRALNEEMDGYDLITSEGSTYSIVSTFASSQRLCRVVSLETKLAFAIKTFCKIKGGEWQ